MPCECFGSAVMLTFVVRPDVRFFCDLNFDPFLLMQDQNKVYGMVTVQSP
jgi:hypothetical protein